MTVPVHGLPPLLTPGMVVAVVPPALKGDRWHEVLSVGEGPNGQLVAFSDISSIADADQIVGCTVLADVAQLPQDLALHDVDALLGRDVTDEAYGPLGTIDEVLVGAAHDVWVIHGPYGEVLVPVVDAFVSSVDTSGPIRVRVPAGTVTTEGE